MTLMAGAAAVDIAPNRPTALYGYPHVERISTGVHDPICASVLYLENGSQSAAIVSLDLLMLDGPTSRAIRAAIRERVGTPERTVFLSCTHTHSAPVTSRLLAWQDDPAVPDPDPEYLEFIRVQTAAAAGEAQRRARPAELCWTTADAGGVGGNRLAEDGPTDPEAGLLVTRAADGGSLIGLSIIYGMHPTVLHEDSTLISSDFPHYARQEIREHYGDEAVVLYLMAPSGDQSPRHFVRSQSFDEAQRLGRKLGATVANRLGALSEDSFLRDPQLDGRLREVDLPRRTIPSVCEAEELLAARRARYDRFRREGADWPGIRTAECEVFGAEGTLTLAKAEERGRIEELLRSYRPIQVQALRIGDAWLAGLPGEWFVQYSLEIKRRASAKAYPVSLVNGDLQGYIVTPEAAVAGGYEASGAVFAPEAGAMMVDAMLAMIDPGTKE